MFYKQRKKKPGICPSQEFNHAIGFARDVIESERSDKDKIIILDFIMSAIREDVKTDLLFDEEFHYPLPFSYFDAQGQKFSIPELGKTAIDLSEVCVLVLPWHRERIKNQANHKGHYFPYLGLYHVHNGRHSVSAGIIHKKKGTIEAVAYDITAAFPHLHTDGCNWFNSHNNEKRHDLTDFRIGILYELSKMKYDFENPDRRVHSR